MESVNTQYTDFLYPVSTVCLLTGTDASYIMRLYQDITYSTQSNKHLKKMWRKSLLSVKCVIDYYMESWTAVVINHNRY